MKFSKTFWREQEGVTSIEYGLIAALIAVAVAVSVDSVGTALANTFTAISNIFSS